MKKVSIVLPVYDEECNIDSVVTSVMNQTYNNIELIIVNECLTDNTFAIREDWADKDNRIIILNNAKKQNLACALNSGFALASGDYLTWTSCDNKYHVDAIATMVNFLDCNTEVDFVYTDYSIVNTDGSFKEEVEKPDPDRMTLLDSVGECFLYRKELMDKVGVCDSDMFIAEDYEYWIRAILKGNVVHLKMNLCDYVWKDKSITATMIKQKGYQIFGAKKKNFNDLYMLCDSKEQQTEFLNEMISLLDNEKEKLQKQTEYYKLNKIFAKVGRKKHFRECFFQYLGSIKRALLSNMWLTWVIVFILPFIFSIYLSVPSADDFTEALSVRGSSNLFVASVKGASNMWKNWGGHWPVQFLEKFCNPLVWSESYRSVGVALVISFMLLVVLLGLYVHTLIKDLIRIDDKSVSRFVFIIILFVFLNTSIYPEIYYWFVGNCYLWELEFALLNGILIVKYFNNLGRKRGILLSLIGFIACFGYLYAPSLGIMYVLVMSLRREKIKRKMISALYPLAFMILGGCLSVFAPGNFVRHTYIEEGIHVKEALINTVSVTMRCYVDIFSNAIFVLGLMGLLGIARMSQSKGINNGITPITLIGAQIISIGCVVFCVALGYGTASSLPNRIIFIINAIIVLWSTLTAFVSGLYLRGQIINAQKLKVIERGIMLVVLLLIVNALNMDGNYIENIPWVKTVLLFENEVNESRYYISLLEELQSSSDDNIVLIKDGADIPSQTGIIKTIGLSDDSTFWVNVALSKWYDKESISYVVNEVE